MRSLHSPKGLSPTGAAPFIMVPLLPLVALAVAAMLAWPEVTSIPGRLAAPLVTLGWLWLAVGVVLWATTVHRFLRGFRAGELITDGPFALCRNPLYASLALFVLPALGLLLSTWTLLALVPVAAWLTVRAARREERDLARVFGAQWDEYAARTGRLLPLPPSGWPRRVVMVVCIGLAVMLVIVGVARPLHLL